MISIKTGALDKAALIERIRAMGWLVTDSAAALLEKFPNPFTEGTFELNEYRKGMIGRETRVRDLLHYADARGDEFCNRGAVLAYIAKWSPTHFDERGIGNVHLFHRPISLPRTQNPDQKNPYFLSLCVGAPARLTMHRFQKESELRTSALYLMQQKLPPA